MYQKLRSGLLSARKEHDNTLRDIYADLVGAVDKYCKDKRENATDANVLAVLTKEKKTANDMIASCPAERTDLLSVYQKRLDIITGFLPQMITDAGELTSLIVTLVSEAQLTFEKKNRGQIMKVVSGALRGKADMKTVSQIVGGMCQ